jgi:hypothetical protein
MFDNTVMREIFGGENDEVTGEWRRLYYEELHDLPCSTDIAFLGC